MNVHYHLRYNLESHYLYENKLSSTETEYKSNKNTLFGSKFNTHKVTFSSYEPLHLHLANTNMLPTIMEL
jgi:hypothetical protein